MYLTHSSLSSNAVHHPRKRFGQNFLEDRSVVDRILTAIDPRPDHRVIEIGPGRGALTLPLLKRLPHLDVIEIDRDLVERWRRDQPPDRLTIHAGDALRFDFAAFGRDLRLVGNLPYNISTPLLFHVGNSAVAIRDAHFMLQREVVARMQARPGSAEFGRLSVMLQYRWAIEALFEVPPAAFRPAPKVWSAVVRLIPHPVLPHPAHSEFLLTTVVASAFGQRRKTLRNSLSDLISAAELETLDIDPAARAEMLGVREFVRIANHLATR